MPCVLTAVAVAGSYCCQRRRRPVLTSIRPSCRLIDHVDLSHIHWAAAAAAASQVSWGCIMGGARSSVITASATVDVRLLNAPSVRRPHSSSSSSSVEFVVQHDSLGTTNGPIINLFTSSVHQCNMAASSSSSSCNLLIKYSYVFWTRHVMNRTDKANEALTAAALEIKYKSKNMYINMIQYIISRSY